MAKLKVNIDITKLELTGANQLLVLRGPNIDFADLVHFRTSLRDEGITTPVIAIAPNYGISELKESEMNAVGWYSARQVASLKAVADALPGDRDTIGRLMHESWTKTKRSQGYHHPDEAAAGLVADGYRHAGTSRCVKCHADMIPWEDLPEPQKDINRHALDAILAPALEALEAREI